MQTEIIEFLRTNSPALFLPSEVADAVEISRSSAQRQLKKLVAKGAVVAKGGRYGCARGKPDPPADPMEALLGSLADETGIPRGVIEDWAEDVKARGRRQARTSSTAP